MSYAKSLAAGSAAESLRTMKRQMFIDSALSFGEAYQRSVRRHERRVGVRRFPRGRAGAA